MSGRGDLYIDYYSSPLTPAQVSLHKASGELISAIAANQVKEGHPLYPYHAGFVQPDFGSFKGPSGDTLYYRVYKPELDRKKKIPAHRDRLRWPPGSGRHKGVG